MIKGKRIIRKKNKQSTSKPEKIIYITAVIAAIAVIIGGYTYSLWSTTETQTGHNSVTASCIDLNVNEGKPINLVNAYGITDQEALEQVPYNIKITNNCNKTEFVDIKLSTNNSNSLAQSNVKASLKGDITYIEPVSINNLINDTTDIAGYSSHHLITTSVAALSTTEYNLYLWIDENTSYSDYNNKTFESKIEINNHSNSIYATDYVKNLSKSDTTNLAYDNTADNNLRYIGSNPNNYVNFNGELWRIIGVMNNIDDGTGVQESRIKLIRNESLGRYSYNKACEIENYDESLHTCSSPLASDNNWSNSSVNELLNDYYYNGKTDEGYISYLSSDNEYYKSTIDFSEIGLNNTSKQLIKDAEYRLGNYMKITDIVASEWYNYEKDDNKTWIGKIGLMNASDYAYASSGNNCYNIDTNIWYYSENSQCKSRDWLLNSNSGQYTMDPSNNSSYIALIFSNGRISNTGGTRYAYNISPVVYLKSDVKILNDGQDGSLNKPYNLSI